MLCEKCKTEHAPDAACPPSEVDRLIAAMRSMHTPASPTPPADPDPPSAPLPTGPTEAEVAAKFEELAASGRYAEAFSYASQKAIAPAMRAMMQPVLRTQAEQNFASYRQRFGDKFTKRESLLHSQMRKYNVPMEAMSDLKTFDDLWKLTCAHDPTYEKEEADSRIAAARTEWEREQAAKTPPASLAPSSRPASATAKQADIEKFVPADTVDFLYRQLDSYPVTEEQYLAQRAKEADPRAVESVGVGPFRKIMWTLTGPVDRPKRKE